MNMATMARHYISLVVALLCSFRLLAEAPGIPIPSPITDLDIDNSEAFAQYESAIKIPEHVAGYRQLHRSVPLTITHPLPTRSSGSVPGRTSQYPAQFLIDLAEHATVVAVVQLKRSKSLLMDDQSFIYSNFSSLVKEVLLDRTGQIIAGDQIVVTRIGGVVTFNDVLVNTVDPEFLAFRMGDRYLLFLTKVQKSRAFRATAPGSFLLDDVVRQLEAHPNELLLSEAPSSFIQDVRVAVSTAAEEESRANAALR